MDAEMEDMLNRPLEEQLAYLRREMAEMREELDLIRDAMRRYVHLWMVENAEPRGPSEN